MINILNDVPLSTISDIKIAIYLHMKTFNVHIIKYNAIWSQSEMVIIFDLVNGNTNIDINGLCDSLKKCGSYILRNNYAKKIIVCCDNPTSPKDVELFFETT